MAYQSSIKNKNIQENWLFKLANNNSEFLYFAFSDVTFSSNFYHGVILNRPSIRESIDLKTSTAKSSNITIEIPDFQYQGNSISKELFGGTNKYINQQTLIYAKINDDTPNQIGSYRLTDISTDGIKIKLSMSSHRPFDYIEFPQDRTTSSNIYIPIVYGEYDENDSSFNTPAFCDTKLYPAPVHSVDEKRIRTIHPRSYSSGSNSHINIWQGEDVFLPLQNSSGGSTDATVSLEGANALETTTERLAVGRVFALESRNPEGTATELSNTNLAFDRDLTTAATASVSGSNNYMIAFTTIPENWDTHQLINIRVRHLYDQDATFGVFLYEGTNLYASGSVTFTANTIRSDNIFPSSTTKDIGKQWTILYQKQSGGNGTLSVQSIKIDIHTAFDTSDADELKRLGDIKFFYSGGDGLTETYSGSSNVVKKIHEAHRDLLTRFTDIGTSDPSGWSDLNSGKYWRLRYWQLQPTSLSKTLEKLQFEGGFIFRYRFDGTPQYIFIQNSYSSSDVTLSKNDIDKIQVSPSPFSELVTKQEISYRKHPAESKYTTTVIASNSTSRTNYNIGSKENISSVKLDAYVGRRLPVATEDSDIPTTPGTNPNDDFYTYYNNIFGDIKLIVKCDIVNPAKWVTENDTSNPLNALEVGSIVDFDNDNMFPETPMGFNSSSWSNIKFMITSMNRKIGKITIEARQIA
jgi:hypothetical protein